MAGKMNLAEFLREGYLQELNRLFLHPLGLAIEVEVSDSGDVNFSAIWDMREDQEGIVFSETVIDDEFRRKAASIREKLNLKAQFRRKNLGWVVQPIEVTKMETTRIRDGFIWCGKENSSAEEYECKFCNGTGFDGGPSERCGVCNGNGHFEDICCEYHAEQIDED